MKQMIFGHLRFDRMSIPENLRDTALWPAVDESALLGSTARFQSLPARCGRRANGMTCSSTISIAVSIPNADGVLASRGEDVAYISRKTLVPEAELAALVAFEFIEYDPVTKEKSKKKLRF